MIDHDKTNLRTQVIDVLCRHSCAMRDQSAHGMNRPAIDEHSPIFGSGLELDSVSFLESILEVERVIGTRLRDETLTEESLATLGSFVDHVLQSAEPHG